MAEDDMGDNELLEFSVDRQPLKYPNQEPELFPTRSNDGSSDPHSEALVTDP